MQGPPYAVEAHRLRERTKKNEKGLYPPKIRAEEKHELGGTFESFRKRRDEVPIETAN